MPWRKVTPMDQKIQFLSDYLKKRHTMSELCERYNISRNTGYGILNRYIKEGPAGLVPKSSRPRNSPTKTAPKIEQALIATRLRHPTWGAKKVLIAVARHYPEWELPHRSTVCDILGRNGMIRRKRRRRINGHPGKPHGNILAPNDVWCADFKGQFKTWDGEYCYPLTVTDAFSRYLFAAHGLLSTENFGAKMVFFRLFKEYGLPARIRTDNGVPFASVGLARLSALSVWWIRLGIIPELIEPGHPQQNGRHERMHRTLKDETTKPPAKNLRGQQRKFDAFIDEYNNERPHEALDMDVPAACYVPSRRSMPNKLPPLEYPDRFEVRYVSENGGIRWNNHWVNVSSACKGEYVGFEEFDDGIWNVYLGSVRIGRLYEKFMRIEDLYARLNRKKVSPMSPD